MARSSKQWRDQQRTKIGDLPNAFLAWHAAEYADPADDLAEFVERMKRWKTLTQEAHTT